MSDQFEFREYSFDQTTREVHFRYHVQKDGVDYDFEEVLHLPNDTLRKSIPPKLLERTLNYLHLAIGTSYYKVFAPGKIVINSPLSQDESEFFTQLYKKGLGEFYFRNNLDIKSSPQFPHQSELAHGSFRLVGDKKKILVGVGGGKDSIVSLELLKEQGFSPTAFVVEGNSPHAVIHKVIETAQIPVLKVERQIDPQLLEGIEGAYNGHIPVSAIYSLIGYLLALLYDFSFVVVGNEHSSNFGNMPYQSVEINHQWSKSVEYESSFQKLCRTSLSPQITYFSIMRPFYEIRIVEQFIKYPQYFNTFTSCNRAFKIKNPSTTLWCGECPKCVFVYLLLSAFLTPEQLIPVFGQNLYEKENLLPLFKDVLGIGTMKPFDCVGTFDEAKVAFVIAGQWYQNYTVYKSIHQSINVSEELKKQVFAVVQSATVPHQFRFTGMKSVLIIGYGREGKATEKYLKERLPNIKIGIADDKTHPEGMKRQRDFDVGVRSPGVPKEKVQIHYTTGTNQFFSQINSTIIGVTGTKGKSTVAALIGHILQSVGMPTKVLGNIGEPLISELLQKQETEIVYVVELSSFQLDDLDYSPQIAVATSLYNDHLDYHRDQTLYQEAKWRITQFQNAEDLFVYNGKVEEFVRWATMTNARSKSFDEVELSESLPLKGEHNRNNMRAAVTVCREMGIKDEDIMKALATFKPLPHRLENVGTFKDIIFFDDAIAVVPEATIAALDTLDNVDTLLLGGTDRGYNFEALERKIREKGVRNLVLFPDTGRLMFRNNRTEFNVLETESMKDAVEFCYTHTRPGSIALLSTASPSYKLWKNFEEKGNEFQKWVKQMSEVSGK